MYSIQFPNMLSDSKTYLIKDHDATLSNLKLLLLSEKYKLLGDPYFGSNLQRMLYNQNDVILKDIIIDDIYTAILTFMPQIRIERRDIKVNIKDSNVSVSLKCTNILDYTTNMYEINLLKEEV